MLQVAINLVVIVSSLGLDQAYGREYHETVVQNRKKLLLGVMIPGAVFTLIVLFGVYLISPNLISTALFSIASPWMSAAVVVCFISAFFIRFFSLALRMQEKGFAFSLSQLLPKLIFLCLLCIFAVIMERVGFEFILVSQVVSMVLVSVLYAWNTKGEWYPERGQSLHLKKDVPRHLAYGLPLAIAGVASWGVFALDRIFLRNLSGFAELGIYSIAASVGAAAGIITSIFNILWAPTAYKWQAEGRAAEDYDAVTRRVLAATVLVFMSAGVLSGLIRFLLPDEYSTVQFLINACMAAPLFYALSEATAIGIGIARKSHYSMCASILSVLVGIIGNMTLIPKFGGAGAAISTAIAIWLFMFLRTEFSCLAWRPLPRKSLYAWSLAMLMMLIAYAMTGARYYEAWVIGWAIGLLIAIVFFRSSVAEAISLFKSLFESRAKFA